MLMTKYTKKLKTPYKSYLKIKKHTLKKLKTFKTKTKHSKSTKKTLGKP